MGEYTGQFAALGAALSWAIGGVIFSRVQVPAAALNLFKNILGSLLLWATMVCLAASSGGRVLTAGAEAWGWLTLSSVTGLVIGDTCYFRSLQIMGPRRGLVLTTLSPPLAGGLGWWLLGETLGAGIWVGMAITLGGVVVVIRERGMQAESSGHYPGSLTAGLLFGGLGALGQALGAIASKEGIHSQTPPLDTVEASFIRLVTAVALGLLYPAFARRFGSWSRLLCAPGVALRVGVASFCGTYLGIWLSLVAFRDCPSVAVAVTLTSLTPVFVIPIVAYFLRQRISARAAWGAAVAVVGVYILFIG